MAGKEQLMKLMGYEDWEILMYRKNLHLTWEKYDKRKKFNKMMQLIEDKESVKTFLFNHSVRTYPAFTWNILEHQPFNTKYPELLQRIKAKHQEIAYSPGH
jgi:hypothetical protein